MKFLLEIECDNDAFFRNIKGETARVLTEAARRIKDGEMYHTLRDVNGNRIGDYQFQK